MDNVHKTTAGSSEVDENKLPADPAKIKRVLVERAKTLFTKIVEKLKK